MDPAQQDIGLAIYQLQDEMILADPLHADVADFLGHGWIR
jgi:hypothetical protein